MANINQGDRVQIRPEWRDRPEIASVYVVLEMRGDRALIQNTDSRFAIAPVETVRLEMIQAIGDSNL